jgi:2-polyprenyl-6-hydroxyphenyl methylase/3-demethylubiquinone-9 3-methyltransferase
MRKISANIYAKINNSLYDSDSIQWWNKNAPINLIESMLNPVRIDYFKRTLDRTGFETQSKTALEVGCGGGLMTEPISKMGFKASGIDPSEKSISCAMDHSTKEGISINYLVAAGEKIPFPDNSFDVIFCCDVLEHVRNFYQVISEIKRVLKKGGIFFYDTINRTFLSWLIVIKIMQDWRYFAVLPANLHVWKMFIQPAEMKSILASFGLDWVEHKGIYTEKPGIGILTSLHKRASGKMSCTEFGQSCRLVEGRSTNVAYMGYAVKK